MINLTPFENVEYLRDLSQDQLRELALENTPAIAVTAQGNLNKVSRNKARMAKFTYVIAPESDAALYSQNTITRAEADRLIAGQRAYIDKQGKLLDVRGFLGLDSSVPAGYEKIHYTIRVKGDGTAEQYRKAHEAMMATSPNFYNINRAIDLESSLIVD